MKRIIAMLFCIISVGCTANHAALKQQIIDRTDRVRISSAYKLEMDADECARYAVDETNRVNREASVRAVAGALLGAATGVGISKAYDVGGTFTTANALLGAVLGAGSGAASTKNRVDELMRNCMTNRGYLMLY